MKSQKPLNLIMRDIKCGTFQNLHSKIRNEKGIALVMVLVLSAIVLIIMAGLIYMLTTGTQISGMQKKYKNASEAGIGGRDITYQLIGLRGDASRTASFLADVGGLSPPLNNPPHFCPRPAL